ncbi:MAG: hypothetical protein GXP47_09665 [Acidobacteria bacterium]|nr:hypothetical protein [Acidobacteriota bacterium]
MGLIERIGFWRRVGAALNTGVGTRLMTMSRAVVNLSTRALPAPRIDGMPPFTALAKPLPECRVAVVNTAGLYLDGDAPFNVDDPRGDASFRQIPSSVSAKDLRIAHAHYPHGWWEQDREVILPLDRLRELEAAGVFGLAPRFFSFGFGGLLTREYIDPARGTAQAVARCLADDGVDLALLVPA